MGELKRQGPAEGPYEHLLQRLETALDEAEELEIIAEQPQMELELRGLTGSEVALIQAYLERDQEQLLRWHETVFQATGGHETSGGETLQAVQCNAKPMALMPEEPPDLQLCCAICGESRDWQRDIGVQVCQGCGSQLFRAISKAQ